MTSQIEITKAEALDLIRANSWDRREDETTCGHRGCEDHPVTTRVIHTATRGGGADWEVADALAAVEAAQTVQWSWSLLGHDLFIVTEDDRLVSFEVRAPDEIRDRWADEVREARRVREVS